MARYNNHAKQSPFCGSFIPLSRTSGKTETMETTHTDSSTGATSTENPRELNGQVATSQNDFGYPAPPQFTQESAPESTRDGVLAAAQTGQSTDQQAYPIPNEAQTAIDQSWATPPEPATSPEATEGTAQTLASTATPNTTTESHAKPLVPSASPVPQMTPWTEATPVPPTAIRWPGDMGQPQTPEPTTQQSLPGRANPLSEVNESLPTPPPTKKSGWIKPALIGGLVGALTSGAILGGVLASTRKNNNDNRTTQASSGTPSVTSAMAPQTGGTKIVPALTATGQADVPRIVSELSKSIVTINTKGFPSESVFGSSQVPEGAGTGIVLSKDGFVLTNAHVIADAQTIKVTIPGGKTCQADVVGRDRTHDVAVVKCRNVSDFVPAALGKSGEMKVGESVVAIGNALALEGNPTVTTGILSATNRTLEGDGERLTGLLQTDAAINPGNSGGPLVNARGQVIGMNTAIYQNTNNIGFAIPIDSILPIVGKIRSGELGKPKTFLGVTTQTMDAEIQKQYSLGTDKGAIVVDVTVGSPAQNAGLQRGDIITNFDGIKITDNKQLGEQVRKHKSGDVVDMTFLRGSQSISSKVTLGSALSDV
jgi:S1-C subfamily serine protease